MYWNADEPSIREDTGLHGFSHMLDLKPSIPMDWSAKGVSQCATEHCSFLKQSYFFSKVFFSCSNKVSQSIELC